MEQVYAEIDQLEKTPSEGRLYTEYVELYAWFLLPGLGLVILETCLAHPLPLAAVSRAGTTTLIPHPNPPPVPQPYSVGGAHRDT